MSRLIYIALLGCLVNDGLTAKLPDNILKCSLSSPELKACLTKAIPDAITFFKDGYASYNLPSLDPMRIPNLVIGEGTGPVNVVQNFSNVEIYGFADAEMVITEADMDKHLIVAQSVTKKIELLSDYSMNGRILVLPVSGKGKCNITIVRAKTEHHLVGETYDKKGTKHYRLKEYNIKMEPEKMYYDFQNLFDGDERLGGEINKVMNENWQAVYADVKAGYEKAYGVIFLNLANILFSKVAFDDIFLP